MAKMRRRGPDGTFEWVEPDATLTPDGPPQDIAPRPERFMQVEVKFPASGHPSQPKAVGFISDIVDGLAVVAVLPSRIVPATTLTVAHRAIAKEKDGWWQVYERRAD